jgi:phosphohistidine phosphatase
LKLFLIRHGDAEAESQRTRGDFARALTKLGRRQASDSGQWLADLVGESAPRIWTSPLVRAVQTAEIVAAGWPGASVTVATELATGQPMISLLDLVRGLSGSASLLVGHEPSMSELGGALLERYGLPFPFKKAAVLALSGRRDRWRFSSYRTPFGKPIEVLPV